MSRATPRILETVTRVAPLAVRFADASTGAPVGQGLAVAASPAGRAGARADAVGGAGGTFVWHDLPGLRSVTFETGDRAFWDQIAPRQRAFVVTVRDALGRYLPVSFTARAPWRGPFGGDPGWFPPGARAGPRSPPDAPESPLSPPATTPGQIPLYSAPHRPPPAGAAALRLELRDARNAPDGRERPAAWAVVTLEISPGPWSGAPAPRWRGVADVRGQVLVTFPYPAPPPVAAGGGSPPRTVAGQEWSARLTVHYRPWWDPWWDPQSVPAVAPLEELFAQLSHPPGTLADASSPSSGAVEAVTFRFGKEELFVGPDPVRDKRSILYVTPAA